MQITPMTPLPSHQSELLEEALSEIFECLEDNKKKVSDIEPIVDKNTQKGILSQLRSDGLVSERHGELEFTKEGLQIATRVIRQKRLAERLLKDVLNLSDEFVDPAACQWEHILSHEVTNSICTLLGHPTQSPHELPIPPGDCCKSADTEVAPVVCPLDNLNSGDTGKVTYLLFKKDPNLGRLLSLGLVPGTVVKVIQKYPTFVVEANESQLAFDEGIAAAIYVHPLR